MAPNLYKAITRVDESEYVDWYKADNLKDAMVMWENDRIEFGLPETATVKMEVIEQ